MSTLKIHWMGTFALVLALLGSIEAWSCSLAPPDANLIKHYLRNAVASELSLPSSSIPMFKLTQPKVTFMLPIEADCSGLEGAFNSAAYHFKKSYPTSTCTHQGVAILKSYGLPGSIEVQDSTSCVGIPIPPTSSLDGYWLNRDAGTNYITRIVVSGNEGQLQVWGKCTPRDCVWGSKPLNPGPLTGKPTAVYVHGNKTRYLTVVEHHAEIELRSITRTTIGGRTTTSTRVDYFQRR